MSDKNQPLLPSRIYDVSEVLRMYPLLTTYSSLLEKKYEQAENSANRMALMEENSEELRICELELDMILDSLLEMTAELKSEYGIGIFDPVTGALKIPCYGKSSRTLVFIYFDSETVRDETQMMCKRTEFGTVLAGLTPYSQS